MARPGPWVLMAMAALPLLATACEGPPWVKIEAAFEAQEQAVARQAADYAHEGFEKVLAYRAALDAEVERQARRPRPFRTYGRASELADSLRLMAEASRTVAAERHAAYRMEAGSLMADGADLLRELRRRLAARVPGLTSGELAVLREEVEEASSALTEAQAAYDEARFREARERAATAVHSLYEVRGRLPGPDGGSDEDR